MNVPLELPPGEPPGPLGGGVVGVDDMVLEAFDQLELSKVSLARQEKVQFWPTEVFALGIVDKRVSDPEVWFEELLERIRLEFSYHAK